MSDIVERLRNWRTVHLARLHLLMEEAADEMEILLERLQSYDSGYTNGISSRSDSKPDSQTGSNSRETGGEAAECHSHGEKCPERERVANHPATQDSSTLTDAEREAVAYYLGSGGPHAVHTTLRSLLARLSPPAT